MISLINILGFIYMVNELVLSNIVLFSYHTKVGWRVWITNYVWCSFLFSFTMNGGLFSWTAALLVVTRVEWTQEKIRGGGFKVFIVVYITLCAWVGHTYADAHIHHIGWFLSHLSTSPESMQHGFWSIICGGFTSTQFNFQCVCISGRFVFCCKICWWLWSTGSFPILELQLSFCYINFILDKL